MQSLEFCYEGMMFSVQLEREEIKKLYEDPEKLEEFKNAVYRNYLEIEPSEEKPESRKEVCKPILNVESKTWNTERTKSLITLRLQMEREFTKPVCKKNKLWLKIADQFNKINNTNFSGLELNTKYRNLLQTYRANKLKKNKTGEGLVNWEYFETFDEVLGSKASVMPPPDTLGGNNISCVTSLPSTSTQEVEMIVSENNQLDDTAKFTEKHKEVKRGNAEKKRQKRIYL